MALDKQKILNELGSVVNQLQSADCGCMGKIFTNSGQTNPNSGPLSNEYNGGIGNYCGHHGHHACNAPCGGEPCSGARHCMGFCNPPKLYSDTYNYLNQNMMQPVVQEVYDDLKSINPANTIMNNPMAAQMGLSQNSNPNQGNMMDENIRLGQSPASCNHQSHTAHHFGNIHMNTGYNDNPYFVQNNQRERTREMQQTIGQPEQGNGQMGQTFGQIGQGMTQMGQSQLGQRMDQMGPGLGQFGQGIDQRGNAMSEMGQTRQGMVPGMGAQIVNMMSSNLRKNYRPDQDNLPINGAVNSVPNSPEMSREMSNVTNGAKAEQYKSSHVQNNGYMGMNNIHSGNNATATSSHMSQPNMAGNMRQYDQVGNMAANSQMNSVNHYGQHSAGLSKFNEMFPGVMKGDLGFDPMTIAIQMNPANQQRSAMDSMQKMMNNSAGIDKLISSPVMQPVINATNAVTNSLGQPYQQVGKQLSEKENIQQQQKNIHTDSVQNKEIVQREYNAVSGSPNTVQQKVLQYLQPSVQTRKIPNQPLVGSLPAVPEESNVTRPQKHEHVTQSVTSPQYLYREPILPADNSRYQLQSHHFINAPAYDYNTIGQPVQMISPPNYQTLESVLPQTISGQVVPTKTNIDPMKFNNVKATVSKTALVGTRPTGKTPSRSQLHHLYNQYKGSQSFTQQNIKPAGFIGSYSEGRISVPPANAPIAQYIERVGGDTGDNDEIQRVTAKEEPKINDIGDTARFMKQPNDSVMTRARNGKTRNGLQDQVFSSFPTSAKWSFHGSTPAPYSVGHRFLK